MNGELVRLQWWSKTNAQSEHENVGFICFVCAFGGTRYNAKSPLVDEEMSPVNLFVGMYSAYRCIFLFASPESEQFEHTTPPTVAQVQTAGSPRGARAVLRYRHTPRAQRQGQLLIRTLETMSVVESENPLLLLRRTDKTMEQHRHIQGVTSEDETT